MARPLHTEIDVVAPPAALAQGLRRHLIHHHFEVTAPDPATLVASVPTPDPANPLHVADTLTVHLTPLGSGALHVEIALSTGGQSRAGHLGLVTVISVVLGLTLGMFATQSGVFRQLLTRPDPDDVTITVLFGVLLTMTLVLPVAAVAVMLSRAASARRRALALMVTAVRGLAAEMSPRP